MNVASCISSLAYHLQDITTRVIAEGLRPEHTALSKIMTRNPLFVSADSLAIEALQKMVQGELSSQILSICCRDVQVSFS